jgi:hypothetical protein
MNLDSPAVVLGTAAIGAGLLYYFVFANKKSTASSSGKGRDSIASDSAAFDSSSSSFRNTTGTSGEAAGKSKRLAEARKNPCVGDNHYASMVAEAKELKEKGALWHDPDFTHDEESLFIDADCPPSDWLRDGERGKVLKDVHAKWCTPPQFCLSKRPMGKNITTGEPTWLCESPLSSYTNLLLFIYCLVCKCTHHFTWYNATDDDKDADAVDDVQSAEDVSQGSLGDCYFLSALALATRDSLECTELIDDSMESAGIYGVTFKVDGKWRMVWVDSFFPCFVSNNVHGCKFVLPTTATFLMPALYSTLHSPSQANLRGVELAQRDLADGGGEGIR